MDESRTSVSTGFLKTGIQDEAPFSCRIRIVTARGEDIKFFSLFHPAGCDASQVDARNVDGSTPLCDACSAGSLDCVKLLLEHGAKANPALTSRTASPLHEACMGGECFTLSPSHTSHRLL